LHGEAGRQLIGTRRAAFVDKLIAERAGDRERLEVGKRVRQVAKALPK
jgi:hypothetical protein